MTGSTKRIELRVLGPVAVTREGIECAIGGTRARAPLAYLALNRRPVSHGLLEEDAPKDAAEALSHRDGPARLFERVLDAGLKQRLDGWSAERLPRQLGDPLGTSILGGRVREPGFVRGAS